MVEEYEIERVERQKLFLQDQQQRKATIAPLAPSAAASFLSEKDNSIISEKSSLCAHFPPINNPIIKEPRAYDHDAINVMFGRKPDDPTPIFGTHALGGHPGTVKSKSPRKQRWSSDKKKKAKDDKTSVSFIESVQVRTAERQKNNANTNLTNKNKNKMNPNQVPLRQDTTNHPPFRQQTFVFDDNTNHKTPTFVPLRQDRQYEQEYDNPNLCAIPARQYEQEQEYDDPDLCASTARQYE